MASNVRYEDLGSDMAEDEIKISKTKGNIFEKPHRLIHTDEEGLFQIDADVLSELSRVKKEINVVGVCGFYRTGKSYLMNWIAGETAGFDLGYTTESKTKGIWVWCRQHPTQSDQVLVLLDTEGLDDPLKGDPEHDINMFCLTLLMSSTLIINVKGVFDLTTLKKLAFIATLTDTIKILDDEAGDKNNGKAIEVAAPTLIMCLRDFHLKRMKNGKPQSSEEYLEDNLKSVDLSSLQTKRRDTQRKFNTIKECIKEYFPKRTCCTIAQPAVGDDLQKLGDLDERSLEKRFVENIKEMQSYVYNREPKYICNASKKTLDGTDLGTLVTFYVDSLNKGIPLNCQDAYKQTSIQRNERVFKEVLTNFKKDMDKFQHIENKERLQSMFLPLFDESTAKYRENSFLYHQDEFEDRLMTEMQAYLAMMKNKIYNTCMEKGTKTLSKMYDEMLKKYKERDMTGEKAYKTYEADMEKLKMDFFEEKKLYDKDVLYKCFDDFTKSKADENMAMYHLVLGQKNKSQYDKSHDEINKRMNSQLERVLLEEQVRRNQYLEKELAELRAHNKELSKSLREKSFCSIM